MKTIEFIIIRQIGLPVFFDAIIIGQAGYRSLSHVAKVLQEICIKLQN